MTTITDMVAEVRMLELNRRIAHVKVDTPIDDKDRLLKKYADEILCLRKMYDGVWDKVHDRDSIIKELEDELSSRGEDSKVLMDVVGIVKAWDERSGQAFPTMYELCDRLVDYIDVPELPIIEDDSSGAEDYHVVVKVGFLEG